MTCVNTFRCLQRSDKNAIWCEEVGNSRPLGKEFRVREDVESAVGFRVGLEDGTHGLGGTTWYSWFFNDNFGGTSNSSDAARSEFNIAVEMKYVKGDRIMSAARWCQGNAILCLLRTWGRRRTQLLLHSSLWVYWRWQRWGRPPRSPCQRR